MSARVKFSDFRAVTEDNFSAFVLATEFLRNNPGSTLFIEPGAYDLTTPLARKIMDECISGKYGHDPEPTMFSPKFEYSRGIDFSGVNDATVEGYGVTLLVDGFMEVLSVRNCTGVTVKGITVDHKRKPYSVGEVIESEPGYCVVRFFDGYPITENAPFPRYVFYNRNYNIFEHMNDKQKPRVMLKKNPELIAPQTLRFGCKRGGGQDIVGLWLVLCHTFHFRPAVFIGDAKNTVLKDVTVHSQSGMGVLGYRSENILLSGLKVVPSVGEPHSTNTDATHFASCKGVLRFEHCHFEGHGDDATNVHTYYHTVRNISVNRCEMFTEAPTGTHAQALDYPNIGDILELTDKDSLDAKDRFRVISVIPHFDEMYSEVELDRPLPEDAENYFLANASQVPRLEVKYCDFRNHLARSILCKNRGVLIEDNTFMNVDAMAVEVAAEGWWKEGIASSDIVIRRNRMINCRWGGIEIKIDSKRASGAPIKNVLIEDNDICCPYSPRGILIRNVDGLTLRRNRVVGGEADCIIEDCERVDLSEA